MSDNNILMIILIVVLLILIIVLRKIKAKQEKTYSAEIQKQNSAPAPVAASTPVAATEPAPAEIASPETPTVSVPEKVDGKQLAYHYEDVDIIPVPGGADMVNPGEKLTLTEENGIIKIFQHESFIGSMSESKITDMVRDWKRRGDPILTYISKYSADSTSAQIAIFFYRDQFASFMKKHPDAKKYRLTGKPDEFAGGYSAGDRCTIEMSADKEDKYEVLQDGSRIGYLPASAVNYANDNGVDPEDLKVIIAEVDYDVDKDRDIISVYITK